MTDPGQDGDKPADQEMPPTPGEQPAGPPGVISQSGPPPGQPPPRYSGPPPGASPPPPPKSSFPSHDSATMKLIPIPTSTPVDQPVAGGERRIGKYIVKRELGRGGMGAVYL